jgi:hypothetical protein
MLDMKLSSILAAKKDSILKKWFELIMESYPAGGSNQLAAENDKFNNPTSSTISEGIEGIFDEILRGPDDGKPSGYLGDIVRLRAVQDFLPSEALSFFVSLKGIIRDELRVEITEQHLSHEMLSLEATIDSLLLSAFDVFMERKEKIYEIKVNEVKRDNFRFIQIANRTNAATEDKNNLEMKEEG